jgi:hypothetical protein
MKLYKFVGSFFVILLLSAAILSTVQPRSYTHAIQVDSCNQEFTYNKSDKDLDFDDSRVNIDLQSYQGDNDRRVVFTAKSGYVIIYYGVDYTGNDDFEASGNLSSLQSHTYTAPDNQTIDNVSVKVKKVCASSTPTSTPTVAPTATATPEGKVYWCHCEPNGNCQTLHLPISALTNAGHANADGNPLHAGDYAGQCVNPTQTPTSTPVWTPTTTPFVTATPFVTQTPIATDNPCEEDCNEPTPTPTPTVTLTPTPISTPIVTATPVATIFDVCANIEGIQTSVPDGKHLDAGNVNCVEFSPSGPSESSSTSGGSSVTPQVLGASTMAATGVFEESLFYSLFSFGSLLTSFGIMRNGKKRAILIN